MVLRHTRNLDIISIVMLFSEMKQLSNNSFHIFELSISSIEVLPSLNEIASTGLGLDLYCNVSRPNNIKQRTQDIKDDDFIFEHSLLY